MRLYLHDLAAMVVLFFGVVALPPTREVLCLDY